MNLISVANPKTTKSEQYGYLTGILHLKPDYEICPNASKGCMAACLNTAGRGNMSSVQDARKRRTTMFKRDRELFKALLYHDIGKLQARAKRKGLKLAIRLNGTSDIAWHKVYPELFKHYSGVMFYDYTPSTDIMRDVLCKQVPGNYKHCFSLKEDNKTEAIHMLRAGLNVAVVFRDGLPKTWQGYKVVDGDMHDLRFLDPENVVVGLKAKGKARKDTTGFVQEAS